MKRVAEITMRVARWVMSSSEDVPFFSAAFERAREQARAYKQKLEEKARDDLRDAVTKEIKDKGFEIVSVDLILGKYRGSRFVTSSKIRVTSNDVGQARSLVNVLKKYHPKFELKNFDSETKVAEYNIR